LELQRSVSRAFKVLEGKANAAARFDLIVTLRGKWIATWMLSIS
jgi:hypothetical protein